MTEQLSSAGTGLPTVLAGDKFLHSRYNPAAEAEKYVKSLNLSEKIRFFILIEPGLGYIIPVLKRLFPAAKAAVLHVSDFFVSVSGETAKDVPAWSPGSGISPEEFLERELPDAGIDVLKIVEWRPALAAYGTAYKKLLEAAVYFIRRADANARTVRGFGRRWVKNFFRNLDILRVFFRISPGSLPWIVTGAGPGLEESLPAIALMRREGAALLASSSSVPALASGGIMPDLAIAADGGGWARFHLWETIRLTTGGPLFLAASLTAAIPCQYGDFPVLPLSDGSLWQEAVLEKLGIPRLVLPQRGTVTASALDLALRCTKGEVFLAGMDLANEDIKTHARPYALDRFRDEGANRLDPQYSRAFVRAGQISASCSHRVYAEWFGGRMAAYPGRIRSLGKNNPVFDALPREPAMRPGSQEMNTRRTERLSMETRVLSRPARQDEAVRVLTGLLSAAGPLQRKLLFELGDLLLPGSGEASAKELIKIIGEIKKPDSRTMVGRADD
ncbi:MAG: DUF115 domain-containing protein [Treponema sp.]|jgi:hypothetical protein|nr:DUF115 domain-containing protein [Treponema sp.]